MPYGANLLDLSIANIVALCAQTSVLDIGAGAGRFGQIVRRIEQLAGRRIRKTAVEMDSQYIEQFQLRDVYDEIIQADAMSLVRHHPQLTGADSQSNCNKFSQEVGS